MHQRVKKAKTQQFKNGDDVKIHLDENRREK